jgi:hypothetical protein
MLIGSLKILFFWYFLSFRRHYFSQKTDVRFLHPSIRQVIIVIIKLQGEKSITETHWKILFQYFQEAGVGEA